MRRLILASLSVLAVSAAPAVAQSSGQQKQATQAPAPVVKRDVDAMDVATTPITDLNLRKDEIPQLLIDAQVRPYDLNGLTRCNQISAQIEQFDAMLGDDIDLPQSAGQRVSAGRVAQSVVGSLIPFRGIVREVSGANDQRRRFQLAIEAGIARRAFLKGVGQQRGCRYPARSATREVWEQRVAEIEQANAEKQRKNGGSTDKVAGTQPR